MQTMLCFTLKCQVYSWLQTRRFSGLAQELSSCCLTLQRKPADGLVATEFWSLKLIIYIYINILKAYVFGYKKAKRLDDCKHIFVPNDVQFLLTLKWFVFLRESTRYENLSLVNFWRSPLQQISTPLTSLWTLPLASTCGWGPRIIAVDHLDGISWVTQREKSSSMDQLMISGQRHCWHFFLPFTLSLNKILVCFFCCCFFEAT